MAALTPEQQAALANSTRETAMAFLDDLQHFRAVCSRSDPSPAEIRLVSVALRRLLVDRVILDIACCRTGRIKFQAPDCGAHYRAIRAGQVAFFAAARAQAFGIEMSSLAVFPGTRDLLAGETSPEAKVDLRLDNLLSQKVFYLHHFDEREKTGSPISEAERGSWASRKDIITHVAHYGHAAHSGTPEDATDIFIRNVSKYVRYDRGEDGIPVFSVNFPVRGGAPWVWKPYPYSPTAVDPALFELLSTASIVSSSPDVLKLEQYILAEVSA